jgi:dephospho-CoA kinase
MADIDNGAWKYSAIIGDDSDKTVVAYIEKNGYKVAGKRDSRKFYMEAHEKADEPFSIPTSHVPSRDVLLFDRNPIYPTCGASRVSNECIAHLLRLRIKIIASSGCRSSRSEKNIGESLGPTVARPAGKLRPRIVAIDGVIGAGKTTELKRIEKNLSQTQRIIHEPVQLIYDTIAKCSVAETSDKERQEQVEKTIDKYEEDQLIMADPRTIDKLYIERNWIYSRWVFGTFECLVPKPDMEIVSTIKLSGYKFGGTMMVWTSSEESFERVKARGTKDKLTIEKEKLLEKRLRILFDCPYEWAYGATIQ